MQLRCDIVFLSITLALAGLVTAPNALGQDAKKELTGSQTPNNGIVDLKKQITDETWIAVVPGKLDETVDYLRNVRELQDTGRGKKESDFSAEQLQQLASRSKSIYRMRGAISPKSLKGDSLFSNGPKIFKFEPKLIKYHFPENTSHWSDLKSESPSDTNNSGLKRDWTFDGNTLIIVVESPTNQPKGGVLSGNWHLVIETAVCTRQIFDDKKSLFFKVQSQEIYTYTNAVIGEIQVELYPMSLVEELIAQKESNKGANEEMNGRYDLRDAKLLPDVDGGYLALAKKTLAENGNNPFIAFKAIKDSRDKLWREEGAYRNELVLADHYLTAYASQFPGAGLILDLATSAPGVITYEGLKFGLGLFGQSVNPQKPMEAPQSPPSFEAIRAGIQGRHDGFVAQHGHEPASPPLFLGR